MPVRTRTPRALPGRGTAVLAAAALLAALLAGCTSGADSASSGAAAPAGDSAGSFEAAPEQAAAAPAARGAADLSLARDVVRTASLEVEVADLRAAADRARALAEGAGGGLEAEDADGDTDVLRLRVAPDRLADVLDALARLGRESARTVGSEDVSEQVADLDSRLATQRASVERVRALLARAQALPDVVAVEAQLAEREAALESLQARAAALREKADLATVTLTLRRPAPVPAAAAPRGFRDGLDGGVEALLGAARASAVVVGALLPFLPLLLLGAYALRRALRRPQPGSA